MTLKKVGGSTEGPLLSPERREAFFREFFPSRVSRDRTPKFGDQKNPETAPNDSTEDGKQDDPGK